MILSLGIPNIESQLIKCLAHFFRKQKYERWVGSFFCKNILNLRWQTKPGPQKRK